jgi:transposase
MLREWITKQGSRDVVYVDESGFEQQTGRPHGWSPKGRKVYGDVAGNNRKRTNLIMAQRGKEWLAPMLFDASCTHHTVSAWMEQALLKELRPNSLIIMDNAPFHKKNQLRELLEAQGHTLLLLPPYSPDLNKIEPSFAVIKKRRAFSGLSLEHILDGHLVLE